MSLSVYPLLYGNNGSLDPGTHALSCRLFNGWLNHKEKLAENEFQPSIPAKLCATTIELHDWMLCKSQGKQMSHEKYPPTFHYTG